MRISKHKTAESALKAMCKELRTYLEHTDEDGSNYFIDGLSTENIGTGYVKMRIRQNDDGSWELEKEI